MPLWRCSLTGKVASTVASSSTSDAIRSVSQARSSAGPCALRKMRMAKSASSRVSLTESAWVLRPASAGHW